VFESKVPNCVKSIKNSPISTHVVLLITKVIEREWCTFDMKKKVCTRRIIHNMVLSDLDMQKNF
jgi:hypothetical protein